MLNIFAAVESTMTSLIICFEFEAEYDLISCYWLDYDLFSVYLTGVSNV